jgi:hypothetical protein
MAATERVAEEEASFWPVLKVAAGAGMSVSIFLSLISPFPLNIFSLYVCLQLCHCSVKV